MSGELWRRRCSVFLMDTSDKAWEVSDLHVTFQVRQEDDGVPDNARIRIENLSPDLMNEIQRDYQRVVLQAGYADAPFGIIFDGQIKQFGRGRTDARTTYLDVLAADGFRAYNYGIVNRTLSRDANTPENRMKTIIEALQEKGVKPGDVKLPNTGGILARGKVMYGLLRSSARQITQDLGATWNILDGRVNVTPVKGYSSSQAVVLNSQTGLIGRAEQTEGGITARCLINPQIRVGTIVQLNNSSINTTSQASGVGPQELARRGVTPGLPRVQIPFDRYVGFQQFADVASDGLYRVIIAEFTGDTRGQEWYSDLTLLTVNPVSKEVQP